MTDILSAYTTYEHRIDSVLQNVGTLNSEAGESPKRKNTTFRTQWRFEIKNDSHSLKTGWFQM